MLRNKMSGFTLIELMVVIVIIGVLASLAIPRFTEASSKAKVAEAPRVLVSFESAYLASVAEQGEVTGGKNALIFEIPAGSKWFEYGLNNKKEEVSNDAGDPNICEAKALSKMGSFLEGKSIASVYMGENFAHGASDAATITVAQKMIPNFGATKTIAELKSAECKTGEEWGVKVPAAGGKPDEYGCITKTP